MNFKLRIVACMGILAALVVPASSIHPQQTGDPYVDRVVSFKPGSPASTCCNNPDAILGPPDFNANELSGFLRCRPIPL